MPNKHYLAGRKKEWKVQEALEAEGYMTFRTAGSHTPVDVLAFYEIGLRLVQGSAVWVQVNSKSPISNDEWNVLYQHATRCGAIPVLAICLSRKPIQFYQLLGTRAKNSHVKPWTPWSP